LCRRTKASGNALKGVDSRKVVIAALAGNVAIATCKFGAAYASRSTATLAEAVHSLADTANQGLLLVGMQLAARPANERFPFGRASERYFWPFVVALMLFSIGGAFAVWEGIDKLYHPPAPEPGGAKWSYGVLGFSLAIEAVSFRVAFGEFRLLARGRTWRKAILETRDPTIVLVMAEDAAAIVGLCLALTAVALTGASGRSAYDAAGSIAIGVLLCSVAIVLARVTHGLLIGESATEEDQTRALLLTESTPGIVGVTQLLTLHLGPDVAILAMKVAFRPGMAVEDVEETTNEVERRIRGELPQMRKIFIEADSHGDGRGVATIRESLAKPPRGGESGSAGAGHLPRGAEK
jgi:cation diffusion facilitator family transporter